LKAEFISPFASSHVLTKAGDYLQLTRPRLALLVLVTVAAGWCLAAGAESQAPTLVHTLIAIALLFAGASALNQLLERESDALMARTADRPLPAGKLQPWEVSVIGCILSLAGLVELLAMRQPLAAALGAFALVSYVFIYTPLKSRTTLNTVIGAIPGAVPPLIGWAAARGRLDAGAFTIYLILFLWQIPHFLAIAWIYREQYARAGLLMLPVVDSNGKQTGRQMLRFTLLLVIVSLLPFVLGRGNWLSALAILVLAAAFLYRVIAFTRAATTQHARQIFRASLLYLPLLIAILILDAKLPRRGQSLWEIGAMASTTESTSKLTAFGLPTSYAYPTTCSSSDHRRTPDLED
jgi:protoheme IX farnesyltransferase